MIIRELFTVMEPRVLQLIQLPTQMYLDPHLNP